VPRPEPRGAEEDEPPGAEEDPAFVSAVRALSGWPEPPRWWRLYVEDAPSHCWRTPTDFEGVGPP
jgi:hypothetical protein